MVEVIRLEIMNLLCFVDFNQDPVGVELCRRVSINYSLQLRYMDSRPDEQLRGITMKSSAITLLHVQGASHPLLAQNRK